MNKYLLGVLISGGVFVASWVAMFVFEATDVPEGATALLFFVSFFSIVGGLICAIELIVHKHYGLGIGLTAVFGLLLLVYLLMFLFGIIYAIIYEDEIASVGAAIGRFALASV